MGKIPLSQYLTLLGPISVPQIWLAGTGETESNIGNSCVYLLSLFLPRLSSPH